MLVTFLSTAAVLLTIFVVVFGTLALMVWAVAKLMEKFTEDPGILFMGSLVVVGVWLCLLGAATYTLIRHV